MFLILLFFHWLFAEEKNCYLRSERFFSRQTVWFYAVASILLSVIVWFALQIDTMMGFAAVLGSTVFFIVHGFRKNAEVQETRMMGSGMSDISKLAYLEILDATFSIDGVIGAFPFTLSVPLILIGNGVGAFVVRELTVRGVDRIRKFCYLKNGAMYSILVLGMIMLADSFGFHIPTWLSPIATFIIVGFFLLRSVQQQKKGLPPDGVSTGFRKGLSGSGDEPYSHGQEINRSKDSPVPSPGAGDRNLRCQRPA